MQIIIARSTVNKIADQTQEITNTVISAMGEKPLTVKMAEASVEVTNLKNISVNQVGDRVIVDINDEIFFRHMSLYIKLVTMVMPFVGMLKMVGNMLKAETRSLVEFIEEEKENSGESSSNVKAAQTQEDPQQVHSEPTDDNLNVGKEPVLGAPAVSREEMGDTLVIHRWVITSMSPSGRSIQLWRPGPGNTEITTNQVFSDGKFENEKFTLV
jgi:hypothetical protein